MKWKKKLYVLHRWLGLIISLQLLAWSVGGLMFSILDIENVRGNWDRATEPPAAVQLDAVRITPAEAMARTELEAAQVARVTLRTRFDGRAVYVLIDPDDRPFATVDAATGEVTRRITGQLAEAAALRDFVPDAGVQSTRLIENDPPTEYRGKPLPAYQVVLEHPKQPHIYICPVTADVITRRNSTWRTFDFFWMLHTMDYQGRDNFNHWLLTIAAAIAVLTAASGLVMWVTRAPWRRRGKREQSSTT